MDRNPLHVPGEMHCAKCKFVLTRVNLYVGDGTAGAGTNETEPCPNGCGPLWPVTWEQACREARAANIQAFANGMARAAVVCDGLVNALDHGGNRFRREATASQCAAAIRKVAGEIEGAA